MQLVVELVRLADGGSAIQRAFLWFLLWPLFLAARFAGVRDWLFDQPNIQLTTWNPAQSRNAIQAIVSTPPNTSTARGHLGAARWTT